MKLDRRSLLRLGGFTALLAWLPRSIAKALGYPRALQGPMIGAPGPNHITVWVRTSGAFEVQLEVATDREFRHPVPGASATAIASAAQNFCVTLRAEGLEPDTVYWYRLTYQGEDDRHLFVPLRTRTAPAGRADFRLAFGSCCRLQYDPVQPIWDTVRGLEPDLFLWLGDNIYADTDQTQALVDQYARGRAVERLAPFLRTTPQLATWDDHDFGFNNSDGTSPVKAESLAVFKDFWANPSYGEDGIPGVYFKQSYGGVDLFVLDGRYYRDPTTDPDTAGKTMLGATQKAWLKRELKASSAPFKVIAAGGGWSAAENEEGGDSWGVYLTERNEIFDFIRDESIGGVVLVSGDSHMGELNCIPRSGQGGYDLYDLCSSPLAQMPASKHTRQTPEMRVRDTWTRTVNVGVMHFRMRGDTPTLSYTLHDVLGEAVWDPLVLTPADLTNGVRSWDRLADPLELERLERFKQGKGYYGYEPGPDWPNRPYYDAE